MKKIVHTFTTFCFLCIFTFANIYADDELSGVKYILPRGNSSYLPTKLTIKLDENARETIGENIEDKLRITINNEHLCSPSWSSNSEISCKMIDPASKSTKYVVKISPRPNASKKFAKYKFIQEFSTPTPKLIYCELQSWNTPVKPSFLIEFDQPVTQQSVENNIYIQSLSSNNKKYKIYATIKDKKLSKHKYINYNNTWTITPASSMEENEEAQLVINEGIESIFGNETSKKKYLAKRFATHGKIELLEAYCMTSDKKITSILNYNKKRPAICSTNSYIALSFSTPIRMDQKIGNKIKVSPKLKSPMHLSVQQDYPIKNTSNDKFEVILHLDLNANTNYKLSLADKNSNLLKIAKNKTMSIFNKKRDDSIFIMDEFGQHLKKYTQLKFKTENLEKKLKIEGTKKIIKQNELDSSIYKIKSTNLSKIIYKYNYINKKNKFIENSLEANVIGRANKTIDHKFNITKIFDEGYGVVYGKMLTVPNAESKKGDNTIFLEYTPFEIDANLDKKSITVFLKNNNTGKPVDKASVKVVLWDIEKFNQWKVISALQTNEFGVANFDGEFYKMANKNWQEGSSMYIVAQKDEEFGILPINKNFFNNSRFITNKNDGISLVSENYYYKQNDTLKFNIYSVCPKLVYKAKLIDMSNNDVIYEKKIKNSNLDNAISEVINLNKSIEIGKYQIALYADDDSILDATQICITNTKEKSTDAKLIIIEREKDIEIKISNLENAQKTSAHLFVKAEELESNQKIFNVFDVHSNENWRQKYEETIKNSNHAQPREKVLENRDIEISNQEYKTIMLPKTQIPFDRFKLIAETSLSTNKLDVTKHHSEIEINNNISQIETHLSSTIVNQDEELTITSTILNHESESEKIIEPILIIESLDMKSISWKKLLEINHNKTESDKIFLNKFKPQHKGIYRVTVKSNGDSNFYTHKFFFSLSGKEKNLNNKEIKEPIIISSDQGEYISYIMLSPWKKTSGHIHIKQGSKITSLPINSNKNVSTINVDKSILNHGRSSIFIHLHDQKEKKFSNIFFLDNINKDIERNKISHKMHGNDLIINIELPEQQKLLSTIAFNSTKINNHQKRYIIDKLLSINLLNCNEFTINYSLFKENPQIATNKYIIDKLFGQNFKNIENSFEKDSIISWNNDPINANQITLNKNLYTHTDEITLIVIKMIGNSLIANKEEIKN